MSRRVICFNDRAETNEISKREDVKIRLSKNLISIKAERKTEKKVQKKDFFHSEKSAKVFNYATTVPLIDCKKAKIEFKKGVLKIKAPKL